MSTPGSSDGTDNGYPAPDDVGGAIAKQGQDPAPDAVVPCPLNLSWIEIQLMDMEGNAVPGESYRIIDPNQEKHEGKLDQTGRARIDGIPPGSCEITFPDRDREAWDRV
jgi:hypothetical protein